MPPFQASIYETLSFDIVPLVYKLYLELSPDQNPPLPPNVDDFLGVVREACIFIMIS